MSRNVLKQRIHVAFVAALGLSALIIATSTHAQAPAAANPAAGAPAAGAAPAGGTAEAERVIVTGSNIPTAEEVGPNPVLNLNRDFINKSSERTVENLLRDMPISNAQSIPTENNGTGQQGPTGTTSIALRAFDPGATLVLIDGLRIVPFPAVQPAFYDLNTIPLEAVESIEILKDGASATYGADAVAGVVNIKLYKDYRGAQVDLYYSDTLDKDAGAYSGNVLFGTGDDKMSIVGAMFFYHHNSTFAHDRGNSDEPPFVSSNATPWNLQVSQAVAVAAGGMANNGTANNEFAHAPRNTNGSAPASAYTYSGSRSNFWNFNLVASSFPEQERWGGYASFNDKICDDQVQLYGSFWYEDSKTHDELAPSASGSFFTPGQSTIAIPPHMNLNGVAPPNTPVFVGQPVPPGCNKTVCSPTNTPANAYNPFNPFNQILSGGTRARVSEWGNRLVDTDNISEVFTLGVKGDKLFDGSWGYDASFRYSQYDNIFHIQDVSVSRLNRVMNANDSIFKPGSSDYIGTTVPFNPFGSFFGAPIPSNQATVNYARLRIRNITTGKLADLKMNVYTTDLFDLPAGGVGLAFGAEWRREEFRFDPDDQARLADQIGVAAAPPSFGGRKSVAFYAETQIPIFSPEMGIPLFHSLEFGASGRFEDFRNNDSNVLVPKVDLRWQPFNDEFTVRSTWSAGFMEPSLFALYQSAGFVLLGTQLTTCTNPADPTTCRTVPNPETTYEFTGNRHLQPEDSRAWTGGIVYTPKWVEKFVPGLTMTATIDLYDVERTGVTILPPAQAVINKCGPMFSGNDIVCSHGLPPGEEVSFDPVQRQVIFVKATFANAGREESKGADFSLLFTYQTQNWGTFAWLTQATYLESFIYQADADPADKPAPGREIAGRSTSDRFIALQNVTGGDGFLRWKALSRLDWTWKNFDLNWTVHYLDGFHELVESGPANPALVGRQPFIQEHWVHGTWMFDCQASYTLVFTPPVESQPVAGYSKGGKEVMTDNKGKQIESTAAYAMPCWQTILNNTTVTIGCNNVFGQDPPPMYGDFDGNANAIPGNIYSNLGREVYVELKKKF